MKPLQTVRYRLEYLAVLLPYSLIRLLPCLLYTSDAADEL